MLFWAVVALCSAPSGEGRAASDPSLDWYTLESPHFILHYHSGLEEMAQDAIRVAEEAHILLCPLLQWSPGAKTQVVLTDFVDGANGSARVVPYNLVQLQGAAPELRSTLNDYDDWLRGLIYHEYTHILHIDTMSGVSPFLNRIFGKSLAPNAALPRWYIEGLAVYTESARTSSGRLRSSLFRMMLRTAALENALLSLSAITGVPSRYPGARAWYLYGAFFVDYIARTRGADSLTHFNHIYGARVLPFGMNIVAREAFGADIPSLYDEWLAHLEAESLASWVGERARGGPEPAEVLTPRPYAHDHIRKRPGHNQISYLRNDGIQPRRLVLYSLDDAKESELFEVHGGSYLWLPDGESIIMAELDVVEGYYTFYDLYEVAIPSGTRRRLTEGLRARDPALSPDGTQLVFVSAYSGTSDLKLMDLASGSAETLYQGSYQEQLAAPCFTPDGEQLVMSRFHGAPQGQRDLFLFELATQSWTQLTDDKALDLAPVMSPGGTEVIFASDRSGAYELYSYGLETEKLRRLTHLGTGLFEPAFDGQRLLATRGRAAGFDLVAFDYQALRDDAPLAQAPLRQGDLVQAPQVSDEIEAHGYEPWRFLWPRTWFPEFLTDPNFDGFFSLTLSGADPVGRHSWIGTLSHSGEADDLGLSLSYSFGGWPVDLGLYFSRLVVKRSLGGGLWGQRYREDQVRGGVRLNYPIRGIDISQNLSLSYDLVRYALADPLSPSHDPAQASPNYPDFGFFNSMRVGYSFYNVDAADYAISLDDGYIFGLSARVRDPILGSEYQSFDVSGSATLYLSNPFFERQVLATRLAGGYGWAESTRAIYAIGGIPEQDLVQSLMDGIGIGGSHLRGYAPVDSYGDKYQLLNVEYRLPLFQVDAGIETLPVFIGETHGAVFFDYGGAYFEDFDWHKFKKGLGAELRVATTLGYYMPTSWRLGYAYGLDIGGMHHIYMVMGSQF